MPIAQELRRSFIGRARALEESLRRLVHEIMEELPEEARSRRRYVASKIDLLFGEIEDLVYLEDGNPTAGRDRAVQETRRDYDEATQLLAGLERRRRDLEHKREDLSIEEQRLHAEQLERELDAARRGVGGE